MATTQVEYLQAWRPWHSLYGVRLKREPKEDTPPRELSLIEQLLPEEMLLAVFARLPLASVGAASCVCRQWRAVASAPSLWRAACLEAFARSDAAHNEHLLARSYRGSWRAMYLQRPHVRFDGVYASRNTYIRQGAAEWKVKNSVHLVCYFRYARFFPDGTFAYRTSPEPVAKVAKSLQRPGALGAAAPRGAGVSPVQHGRWRLDESGQLYSAMRYDNSSSTEVRSRMHLRSTTPGANNRLDIDSIVSYDREDGRSVPLGGPAVGGEEGEEEEGAERRVYNRGMATYVFVPWEQVARSVLNLPVTEMDVYIPG